MPPPTTTDLPPPDSDEPAIMLTMGRDALGTSLLALYRIERSIDRCLLFSSCLVNLRPNGQNVAVASCWPLGLAIAVGKPLDQSITLGRPLDGRLSPWP